MTDNQENTDDFLSELKYDPTEFTKYLPSYMQRDIKMSEIYTDFLLNYLIRKRKGIGKIDQLVLDSNKANINLKGFMEKQNATEYGYAEIIKQTDKNVQLKITKSGIRHFNYVSTKYGTKSPSILKRITLYIFKIFQKLWFLIFVTANNRIKTMMESGISKLILFLIAVLGFLLKDEIKAWFLEWWNK